MTTQEYVSVWSFSRFSSFSAMELQVMNSAITYHHDTIIHEQLTAEDTDAGNVCCSWILIACILTTWPRSCSLSCLTAINAQWTATSDRNFKPRIIPKTLRHNNTGVYVWTKPNQIPGGPAMHNLSAYIYHSWRKYCASLKLIQVC